MLPDLGVAEIRDYARARHLDRVLLLHEAPTRYELWDLETGRRGPFPPEDLPTLIPGPREPERT